MKISMFIPPLVFLCIGVQASTWDDIANLEATKQQKNHVLASAPPATHLPYQLADGRSVRTEDWKIVLFMQSACSYCQQFDPTLKQISEQTGIGVFPYTLDGRGDVAFPSALPAGQEVMLEFFGNGLPIATPTTFLVNVHTMATYPLLQGAVEHAGFVSRLNEVFNVALSQGGYNAN
ncbi:TPA: type-F conjugative transfer system pilin assembly thiol-disulfide isomerase TrbB [Aeromonas veronii]